MVIQPQYDEVAIPIKDGVIQVMKNDKWGYVDKKGKELIALQFDEINNFGEGLAHVLQNGEYGYINKAGEFVIQPQYAAAFPFTEGLAAVSINEKWGYIDKRNQVVIPYRYDYVYPFTFGLAAVELDGKWGFIDHSGKEIVTPQYNYVSYFKDGLAEVGRNGLNGFVDRTGKEVIKPQYETVSAFSDGLALVSTRDEYGLPVQGYINKYNQRVVGFNFGAFNFNGGPFENGKGVVSDNGEGTYYIVDKPSVKMNVHPATFRLMVDGEKENVQVFEIDGSTYMKLRDLAMVLNNTNKSFELDYNHESGMIYLTTQSRYTPVSGELAMTLLDKQTSATESDIALEINGDYLTMDAYTIQGNNYFRLSAIAQALNVGITEDPNGRAIKIDTSSEFLSKMNWYSWGW
ncbi:WG repeat-containing protein [Paenibacillus glacialis]|nr:WG repeat-containing protein [Paenibacillus glacialis]